MKHPHKNQMWVNVALFENLRDCQAAERFLTEKRFEARSYNDKVLQLLLFLCPPRLTYRLQVRAGSQKAVTELLAVSRPEVFLRAIHCPACGSLQVNYPQMTRKFFTPTVFLHLGIIFRIIDHECYCESCHYVWNLPKKLKNSDLTEPAIKHTH